ncbi:MAG: GIY-YIG nuclease family protein [Spirochaetaceae bacterium]|jgi:putative endonuclease|nr:GIY-YIG nuclease family protein [Spirochaetaceae bacterium]
MAYTYILECGDGSYYVGSTKNLERRLLQHQSGKGGAKYTRSHSPVKLVYFEEYDSTAEAYRREKELQSWRHTKKKDLIEGRR